MNKLFAMPAMILFKHPGAGAGTGADTLTLSIIDRRLHKKEASKDVLEKVTLIRTSVPRTRTVPMWSILFDLGLVELQRKAGFTNFLGLHDAWRKTLTPRSLNKRFFRELSNWYFHAVEVAEFPVGDEKLAANEKGRRGSTREAQCDQYPSACSPALCSFGS
ncbi:MAG: hypothetical protein IPO87_18000 [Flavobacteriales bacterium]|nr:hypothetical protein [Flavobacteriales bacterium]